jgi:hypothetical protein
MLRSEGLYQGSASHVFIGKGITTVLEEQVTLSNESSGCVQGLKGER